MKFRIYVIAMLVTQFLSCFAQENNFTSPDLDFFNLHGQVKEMMIKTNQFCFQDWGMDGKYKFDLSGRWINPTEVIPNCILERDKEGRIIKILYPKNDTGYRKFIDYNWDGRQLKDFFSTSHSDGSFFYTNNILSGEIYVWYYTDEIEKYKVTASNFKFDKNGNWISCELNTEVSAFNYDGEEYVVVAQPADGKMTRQIIYY